MLQYDFLGLPKTTPRLRAASNPSFVRLEIIRRSNCASAANIPNTTSPNSVDKSRFRLSTLRFTSLALNFSIVSKASMVLLNARSRSRTIRVSPALRLAMTFSKIGRDFAAPDICSIKTLSQTSRSLSVCLPVFIPASDIRA